MPNKCILILLDGLGDRSYEQLDHQTPLQSAKTPVLDRLAAAGANGLYHATRLGQALPSENAHFIMFGYEMSGFPGRGALEALGADVKLGPKDVALLSHFVRLRKEQGIFILEEGKPKITDQESVALASSICEYETKGVTVRFSSTAGCYGIISLSGEVSPFITDSDPFGDNRPLIAVKPWAVYAKDRASKKTADVLTDYLRWTHDRLETHPVNQSRGHEGLHPINGLVSQRAGQLKQVTPFAIHNGLKGLSMASGGVYQGLAKYLGMDFEKVTDTGDPGEDMAQRLILAGELSKDYDFIHVHTKSPDEAAHAKDPKTKKSVIESLDQGIGRAVGPLMKDPDLLIVVTADHSTPSSGPLIHSGESLPVTFFGQGVRRDTVKRFDEISVASGALGNVRGKELMYLILNHLDRSKLQGVMNTSFDQPYWPGEYEPFRY